jgi:hypothetical protein
MTSHFHSLLIPFPLWALAPEKEGCLLAGAEEERSVRAMSEESGRKISRQQERCMHPLLAIDARSLRVAHKGARVSSRAS